MNTTEALQWRYATKNFDPSKKLTADQRQQVMDALRLSASSFGLQPWKFVVVTNPEIRQQLRNAAWDQAQVTDADMLIVLCSLKDMNAEYIQKYVEYVSSERGVPAEALEGYKQMMIVATQGKNAEELKAWMQKQVYIALGTLLTVWAVNQIDAAPMEGFDSKQFDEILKLDQYGIQPAVLCPVGFRSTEDATAQYKKVRFPESELIIEIK